MNPMEITLDPKEVKMYLHRLGYCHITAEQLKDFIKDLKKLIKYDQRQESPCQCGYSLKVNGSSYVDTTPETLRTLNSTSSQSAVENIYEKTKSGESSNNSKQKSLSYKSSNADDCSNRLGAPLLSDVPDSGFRRSKQCKIQKEPLKTRSIENIQQPVRPKSSFIKPWNINCGLPPGTVKRSDPVLLYKQYQDIWKQQKVPGENNHSNLRWCIREHMLGTDPHPRPISQASSIGSRGHRKV
ncbi:hypothetical protein C0J52_04218 [Blattella germanica]|nr:hypothetical protein C0J52_04218 [Blattella germanica]PSN50068.1 hypothetical protein C0J52_04218 [Blattella germanica]